MAAVMTLFGYFMKGDDFDLSRTLSFNLVLWPLSGIFYGLLIWWLMERRYQREGQGAGSGRPR